MKSPGDGEETVYFSGDAAEPPAEVSDGFLAERIARIYHDTSSHESASTAGISGWKAIRGSTARVFCMHLDGDYADMLHALGFSVVEAEP